jgi:hypothetical protein
MVKMRAEVGGACYRLVRSTSVPLAVAIAVMTELADRAEACKKGVWKRPLLNHDGWRMDGEWMENGRFIEDTEY